MFPKQRNLAKSFGRMLLQLYVNCSWAKGTAILLISVPNYCSNGEAKGGMQCFLFKILAHAGNNRKNIIQCM